jgi:hypothetical protein
MVKVLRKVRTTMQAQGMSSIAIARNLEQRERQRAGTKEAARRSLADKLKIGVGTLENIIRARVKSVDERIRDRLQALLVSELEAEIGRLQHELEMARKGAFVLGAEHIGQVEAHLAQARSLLNGG